MCVIYIKYESQLFLSFFSFFISLFYFLHFFSIVSWHPINPYLVYFKNYSQAIKNRMKNLKEVTLNDCYIKTRNRLLIIPSPLWPVAVVQGYTKIHPILTQSSTWIIHLLKDDSISLVCLVNMKIDILIQVEMN